MTRALGIITVAIVAVVGFAPGARGEAGKAPSPYYDACTEQAYDSVDEPCGGGHQHQGETRDENMLDRARHRHRYLEHQIRQLNEKVATLSAEVEKLKAGK